MAFVRLSPDSRRAQLLELGIRLFSERPYDDFSMDDVAAEAGVSKGLLYHYFPSKRHFYMSALRAAVAQMTRLTEPDRSLPVEEQLRIGLDIYLAYVEEHAAAYRAILRGGIGSDPEVAAITEEFRQVTVRRLLRAIGVPHPRPRVRTAIRGWIGLVEAASLDWLDRGDVTRAELVEMLFAALPALLQAMNIKR